MFKKVTEAQHYSAQTLFLGTFSLVQVIFNNLTRSQQKTKGVSMFLISSFLCEEITKLQQPKLIVSLKPEVI